jgi:thiol-disulfide isomerase/thioredoxin
MKKIILFCIVVFSFNIVFSQNKNTKLPSIEIKTVDGKNINTSSISNDGKPILISFWATWCKPCVKELTTIAEVYDDWQKETGVKLIAVSIDDSRSSVNVKPLINGKNWNYEVLLDVNSDFKRAMNVNAVPHTFLINGKGEIVWQHTSFTDGGEIELLKLIKQVAAGEEIKE